MADTSGHENGSWETFQSVWTGRLFVLSFVLLGTVFTLQGVGVLRFLEPAEVKQKPVRSGGLRCDEPVWSLGSVDSVKNPRLSHEFVLVNESKETVSIKKVHSSCGCMVADDYDKELSPGGGTKLRVDLQLPTVPQRVRHDLAVQTETGILPLEVVGEVAANSALFSVPAVVNFGIVEHGERCERTVRLFRYDFSPIDFVGIDSNSELVTYTVEKMEDNGFSITLVIAVKADDAHTGYFEDMLEVITSNTGNPSFLLPVRVELIASSEGDQ